MRLEDLLKQMLDSFKVPSTLEEAVAYIKSDPSMQTMIEEMAFRQVVINVLIAAGIISENDFNASVVHFKNAFTDKFAEELLNKINEFNNNYQPEGKFIKIEDEPEDEWELDDPNNKGYDA